MNRRSLPHSQVPTTCPYPEPAGSSPYPLSHFLKIHLNIFLLSRFGSPKLSLSLRVPNQNSIYASPCTEARSSYLFEIHVHLIRCILLLQNIQCSCLFPSVSHVSPPHTLTHYVFSVFYQILLQSVSDFLNGWFVAILHIKKFYAIITFRS